MRGCISIACLIFAFSLFPLIPSAVAMAPDRRKTFGMLSLPFTGISWSDSESDESEEKLFSWSDSDK